MYKQCPRCTNLCVQSDLTCRQCGHSFVPSSPAPQQIIHQQSSPHQPQYPQQQGQPHYPQQQGPLPGQPYHGNQQQYQQNPYQNPYQSPYQQPTPYIVPPGAIVRQPGTHSVAIAALLAVLLGAWAASIYNGQVAKGLIFWLAGGIFIPFTLFCLAWYLLPIIWIVGIVDSVLVANKLNSGRPIAEWEFF
jgi:TM2 domain-containing membrane protein YozV